MGRFEARLARTGASGALCIIAFVWQPTHATVGGKPALAPASPVAYDVRTHTMSATGTPIAMATSASKLPLATVLVHRGKSDVIGASERGAAVHESIRCSGSNTILCSSRANEA